MKNISELLDSSGNLDVEKTKELWDGRFQISKYHNDYGLSFKKQSNYKDWQRIRKISEYDALTLIRDLELIGIKDSIFNNAMTYVRYSDGERMWTSLNKPIEKAKIEYEHLITIKKNIGDALIRK
jgi:hypothetical protein